MSGRATAIARCRFGCGERLGTSSGGNASSRVPDRVPGVVSAIGRRATFPPQFGRRCASPLFSVRSAVLMQPDNMAERSGHSLCGHRRPSMPPKVILSPHRAHRHDAGCRRPVARLLHCPVRGESYGRLSDKTDSPPSRYDHPSQQYYSSDRGNSQ
jgi:hypothetical protein